MYEVLVVFSRACSSIACQRPSTKNAQSADLYGSAAAYTRSDWHLFVVVASDVLNASRMVARATPAPCSGGVRVFSRLASACPLTTTVVFPSTPSTTTHPSAKIQLTLSALIRWLNNRRPCSLQACRCRRSQRCHPARITLTHPTT